MTSTLRRSPASSEDLSSYEEGNIAVPTRRRRRAEAGDVAPSVWVVEVRKEDVYRYPCYPVTSGRCTVGIMLALASCGCWELLMR